MRRVDASLTDHLRSRLEQALAPAGSPADGDVDRPRRARAGPPVEPDPGVRPRRAHWVADLHEAAIRTVLRPAARPAEPAGETDPEDPDPPDQAPSARTWPRRVTGRHVVVAMSILSVAVILTTVTVLAARDRPVAVAAPQVSAGPTIADGGTAATPVDSPPSPAATGASPQSASPPTASTASAVPTPTGLTVHVAGAVRRPGVVQLPVGARVHDAVTAAGGFAPGAVPGALNLAQPLADGQQVFVSARVDPPSEVRGPTDGGGAGGTTAGGSSGGGSGAGGSGAGGTGSGGSAGIDGPMDLNAATLEQLESLPGVGPVTAAAILAWREEHGRFSSVDELQEVDGIGPKTYQRLAQLVRV